MTANRLTTAVVAVILFLAPDLCHAAGPNIAWSNPFDPAGPSRVIVSLNNGVTNLGWYTQGQVVKLASTDGTSLMVYALSNRVVNLISSGRRSLCLTNLAAGCYFVENGDDRAGFMVLPGDWRAFWDMGDCFESWSATPPVKKLYTQFWDPRMIRVGPDVCRWPSLSDEKPLDPKRLDWIRLDAVVAEQVVGQGRTALCMMKMPNDWQVDNNHFVQNYTNYVAALLGRYWRQCESGSLRLEIWNEPWRDTITPTATGWWRAHWQEAGGTSGAWEDFYCTFLKAVINLKQRLGSHVLLYGPTTQDATCTYWGLFKRLQAENLLPALSGLSFHVYNSEPEDPAFDARENCDQTLWGSVKTTRQIVGPHLPFIVDEIGFAGRSALSDRPYSHCSCPGCCSGALSWWEAMNQTIKETLVLLAAGAGRIEPHVGLFLPESDDLDRAIEFYGWERGRGPKPKTAAYLMLQSWFPPPGQSTAVLSTNDDKLILIAWSKDAVTCLCGWARDKSGAALNASPVTDVFGTPGPELLDTQPAFWRDPHRSPAQALAAYWDAFHPRQP